MIFDVFISYATQDFDSTEKFCRMLEDRGIKCWIAPRDIVPGCVYSESILDGIDQAFGLILIVSQKSNASAHVRNEVERAFSKRKAIFPVRIENVAPSKALELFVMSSQWVEAWQSNVELKLNQLAGALLAARTKIVEDKPASASWPLRQRMIAPAESDSETVFKSIVEWAWSDGILSDSENQYLTRKAKELGIPLARATELVLRAKPAGTVIDTKDPLMSHPDSTSLRCSACGFQNPDEMSFCGKCGVALQRPVVKAAAAVPRTNSCKQCGRTMPETAKFCGGCGASLLAPPAAAAADDLPPAASPPAAAPQPAIPVVAAPVVEAPPPQVAATVITAPAAPESAEPQPPAAPQPAEVGVSARAEAKPESVSPEGSIRKMVLVPRGWFAMGSRQGEGLPDEHPRRQVEIGEFYIDCCAVSNLEYERFDPAHRRWRPDVAERDSDPVVFVTYQNCLNYCRWRAEKEQLPPETYRLPTEAQWERACRAGRDVIYPWGSEATADGVNTREAGRGRTIAVDEGTPNDFGIFHMGDNIREWCLDYYGEHYYASAPVRDPQGPPPRQLVNMIVVRGASFLDAAAESGRCAARLWAHPGSSASDLGFRCIRIVRCSNPD